MAKNAKVAELLLDHGANIQGAYHRGVSALTVVDSYTDDPHDFSASQVIQLLEKRGLRPIKS
ncbi:hypothetical protein HDU93_002091, partial [Gonapodya sp. JEL0774]